MVKFKHNMLHHTKFDHSAIIRHQHLIEHIGSVLIARGLPLNETYLVHKVVITWMCLDIEHPGTTFPHDELHCHDQVNTK